MIKKQKAFGNIKVRGRHSNMTVLVFTDEKVYLDTLFHLQYRTEYEIIDSFWGYAVTTSVENAMDTLDMYNQGTNQ